MANKESPADKAKREAEEKANKALDAKTAAEEKAAVKGDDAAKLSDEESANAAKTLDDVTTDSGEPVEQAGPVAIEVPDDHYPAHRPLTDDELEDLVGDLEPGEDGFLPLDPKGRIIGPAQKGQPAADQLGAPVHAVVQRTPLTLTTPSGAPITTFMNPGFVKPPKPRYG
jgi:hypothetical protein